jgi:hypothetical protein
MSLNFPNRSRSYDARKSIVRFWGYDESLEIPFFVEAAALLKLRPETRKVETGYLEAFDAEQARIQELACKSYKRGRRGSYLLTAADF